MSYFIVLVNQGRMLISKRWESMCSSAISPLCWSLPKRCRFRSGQFIAKSSPATVLIPARWCLKWWPKVDICMWDGCLVMDVDRLARISRSGAGTACIFLLKHKDRYSNKTYDPANEYDNEYFEFSLFMSRREYATIKRRMQRGRETKQLWRILCRKYTALRMASRYRSWW